MDISTTRLDELLTRGDIACYSIETVGVSTADGLGSLINRMKAYSMLFGHIGDGTYDNGKYQFATDIYNGTGYSVGELIILKPDYNNAIVFYIVRDDTNLDSVILYKFFSNLRPGTNKFDKYWKRFSVNYHNK